jgi:hypothetical protein
VRLLLKVGPPVLLKIATPLPTTSNCPLHK